MDLNGREGNGARRKGRKLSQKEGNEMESEGREGNGSKREGNGAGRKVKKWDKKERKEIELEGRESYYFFKKHCFVYSFN